MILGQPQTLAPGFNPMWIYATSSFIDELNFQYLNYIAEVGPNGTQDPPTTEILSTQLIQPRFDDRFMELNINKVLQSRLKDTSFDIDLRDNNLYNNTPSSGYRYIDAVGYQFVEITGWSFSFGSSNSSGNLSLYRVADGNPPPSSFPYSAGDVVVVDGLALEYPYTSISDNAGFVEFFAPGHTFAPGDNLFVKQDSPFQFGIYSGLAGVQSVTSDTVTIFRQFQTNSSLPQTGKLIKNFVYSQPLVVLNVSGPINIGGVNYWELELNIPVTNDVLLLTGSVRKVGASFITGIEGENIVGVNHVFNGAMERCEWLEYDYKDYQYKEGCDLVFGDDFCATASLSEPPEIGDTAWNILNISNGVGTITGCQLTYTDDDEFGGAGFVFVTLNNTLQIGQTYTVRFRVRNNSECTVSVGDGAGTSLVVGLNQTGIFTTTFYSQNANFNLIIEGVGATTHGIEIDFISVTNAELCSFKFLTTVPQCWEVRDGNDILLDWWSANLQYENQHIQVKVGTQSYRLAYDGSPIYSTINAINVGPNRLNDCNNDIIFIDNFCNPDRLSLPAEPFVNIPSTWQISNFLGGTFSFEGCRLNYLDNDVGDGFSTAVLNDVLEVGKVYKVRIRINNGNGIIIKIGDTTNDFIIVDAPTTASGVFETTFTAADTNFFLSVESTNLSLSEWGVDIFNITVTNEVCDILECGKDYEVRLSHIVRDPFSAIVDFGVGLGWSAVREGNAAYNFDGGFVYSDFVQFTGGGGTGSVLLTSLNPVVENGLYLFTGDITNNQNVEVWAGTSFPLTLVVPINTNGGFSQTFIAESDTFYIEVRGTSLAGAGENTLTFRNNQLVRQDSFASNSEWRCFKLNCDCTGRFPTSTLLFLDRKGSFIPFNFTLNNQQRINMSREYYNTFVGDYVANSRNGHQYSLQDASEINFKNHIIEEWTLISDWIDETTSVYLEELVSSANIFIYNEKCDKYVPVKIMETRYDRTFKRNKKLINLIIRIQFINNNEIQKG